MAGFDRICVNVCMLSPRFKTVLTMEYTAAWYSSRVERVSPRRESCSRERPSAVTLSLLPKRSELNMVFLLPVHLQHVMLGDGRRAPMDNLDVEIDMIDLRKGTRADAPSIDRSEEHTSELQSLRHLVCRLL